MRTLLRRAIPAALAVAACATVADAQSAAPTACCAAAQSGLRAAREPARGSTAAPGRSARAEQIKRYEDDRAAPAGRARPAHGAGAAMGCEGRGFFSLFGGQPPQCGPLNNQIQQMRAQSRSHAGRSAAPARQHRRPRRPAPRHPRLARAERLRPAISPVRQSRRHRRLLREPVRRRDHHQPRHAVRRAAAATPIAPSACAPATATISRSPTRPRRRASRRTSRSASACARRPRWRSTATAIPARTSRRRSRPAGEPYTELPNAFAYRKAFNSSCSCRAPGQSWSEALQHLDDSTRRARRHRRDRGAGQALSQPADQRGKGAPAAKKGAQPKGAPAQAARPPRERRWRRRRPQRRGTKGRRRQAAACATSGRPSFRAN